MPALLALVGATAYEADDAVTPQGRANAKYALARILSAARAGGFTQATCWTPCFPMAKSRSACAIWSMPQWTLLATRPC